MSVQPARGQSPDSELARATSQSLSLYPPSSAQGPLDRRIQLERAAHFAAGAGQPSYAAAPGMMGHHGGLAGTPSLHVSGRASSAMPPVATLADDSHGSTDTFGLPTMGPDGSPPAMPRIPVWAASTTTSPAPPATGFHHDDATGVGFGVDFSGRGVFQHSAAAPPGYVGGPTGLSPAGRADTLPFERLHPMYGAAVPPGGFSLSGSLVSGGSFGGDEGRLARGSASGDYATRVAGFSSATSASGYQPKRMREMPSEGSSAGMGAMGSFGVPQGTGQIADTPVSAPGEQASYEQQRRQRLLGVMTSALMGNTDSQAFGKWVFLPPHHVGVIPGLQTAVSNEALVLSQDDLLALASSAIQRADASRGGPSSSGATSGHGGRDASSAVGAAVLADGSHESMFSQDYGSYGQSRAAAGPRAPAAGDLQGRSSQPYPGHGIAAPPPARAAPGAAGAARRRTTPPSMHRPLPGGTDSSRKRDREARRREGTASSSSSSSSSSAAAARGPDGLPPRPDGTGFSGPGNGLHILKHAADSLGESSAAHGAATTVTAVASSSSPVVGPLSAPPPLSPADSEGGRALSSTDSGRVMSRMRRSLVKDARVAEGTRSGTVSSKDGVSWGRVNNPISFVEDSDLPAPWPRVPFPRDYLITNLPPDDARTGRLTRDAVQNLRTWMTQGRTWLSPYPTPADIAALSERTGMSPKQLRDWFRNERKRVWLPFWQSRLSDPGCPWAVQRSSGGRANIIPKDVLERFSHYSSDLDLNTAITLDVEAADAAGGARPLAQPGVGAAAFGGSPGGAGGRM